MIQAIQAAVQQDPASAAQATQITPEFVAGLAEVLPEEQLEELFSEIGHSRREPNPPAPEDDTQRLVLEQPQPLLGGLADGGYVDMPGYYKAGGLSSFGPAQMRSLASQAHYTGANIKPAIKPPGVHLINSSVPGRTDRIPMRSAPGSFVLPADVVSGVGQGNTKAGAQMWGQLIAAKIGPMGIQNAMRKAALKTPTLGMGGLGKVGRDKGFAEGGDVGDDDLVPIVTAGGECLVDPEIVCELGDGDPDRGKKVLSDSVMAVRKHVIEHLKSLPKPAK